MFVVDLGVPRNVDSDAADLYNLYLYNIDDLGEIVEQNKNAREAEIPRAEAIIDEHVAKFESWRAALEASFDRRRSSRAISQTARSCLLREHLAEWRWHLTGRASTASPHHRRIDRARP